MKAVSTISTHSNLHQKTEQAKPPIFYKGIQTKLTIGQPGDKYEQEADAMADQVVQRLAEPQSDSSLEQTPSQAPPLITAIQRKCNECAEEEKLQKMEGEEEELQKKPIFESEGEESNPIQALSDGNTHLQAKCEACEQKESGIHAKSTSSLSSPSASLESRLSSSKGSGSPLSSETQHSMEGAFGADFSGVRVHTDNSAVQMNKELGAQAFTHGSDIYFNQGKYDTGSTSGKHLLAHELTHTVQQGGSSGLVQRATTRGAGGCGPPNEIDEDRSGARGAGITAHRQIQQFLSPRAFGELPIPRATKTNINDQSCQSSGINEGYADLFTLGMNVGIAEIKPYPWATRYAIPESEHYIRRGTQSMERFSNFGNCAHQGVGPDDTSFANRLGTSRNRPNQFYKINNLLSNDTVIGDFDGDSSRTLKARLVAPGAVGYWCTGGGSNTYTCGISSQQTEEYIDRILLPAQDLVDELLKKSIEEPLDDLIENFSIQGAFNAGVNALGGRFSAHIQMLNGMLPPGVTLDQVFQAVLRELGPFARAYLMTLLRKLKSELLNQMRLAIRNQLRKLIEDTLATLCVGVPIVSFVQLMNELKRQIEEMMKQLLVELIPVVATKLALEILVAMYGAIEHKLVEIGQAILDTLGMIGEFLWDALIVVLRALAILAIVALVVGAIVLGIIALITTFDPILGDEVLAGAGALALLALIPAVWSFVINGVPEDNLQGNPGSA